MEGMKDGQTLFYRTFPVAARGPIIKTFSKTVHPYNRRS